MLRHGSLVFAEDPVRTPRVARFASRFADFRVAPETLALMRRMVEAGEVHALVAECATAGPSAAPISPCKPLPALTWF